MLFSSTVASILTSAGWHSCRRVIVSSAIPSSHPAAAVLSELGGLNVVPISQKGIECGTSSISFQELPFDPVVQQWNGLLRTELVGIAEVADGHGFLYIASDGRCFGMSDIHDAFYYEGLNAEEAVERLLTGLRARPMLRPDQASVMLYGQSFVTGDPALYPYC